MRVTIVEVAKLAGVSIKTVSRVINREPHVRPAVQEKVERAIAKLGYVPNAAARALSGSRSFVIAAFYRNPSLYYISELQKGAMRVCREHGYHLIIEEVESDSAEQLREFEHFLRSVRLDGAILSPPVTDDIAVLARLDAAGIAYVRLAPATVADRSHALFSDDEAGAALLARHLWSLGHRRIGLVTGPAAHLASRDRRSGFLDELERCGLSRKAVEIVPGDFSFDAGMAAGIQLLTRTPRVTAIFACNDDMASGVVAAAARLGIAVPDAVSVVGYDDSSVATQVWPPLTTIRQPIGDMAAQAARLLIGRKAVDPPVTERFGVQLIDRKSTGINRELVR
jgi:LacI family transcriptional regulator